MEFDLIEAIRARTQSARSDVALGIGDDAALLDVPAGERLVACTDSMVEGVHFLRGTDPADIGWKALAVNLSDLAAMGADPAWALLALTLPAADASFVERFAEGFAVLAGAHRVALVGGDTTQGPLAITVTALGLVPRGAALTRSGARVGDAVLVTGTLGDAAGALTLMQKSRESHPPRRAARSLAFAPSFLRKGEAEQPPFPAKADRSVGEGEQHPLPAKGDRSVEEAGQHPLPQEGGRRAAAGGCSRMIQNLPAMEAQLVARLLRPAPRVAAGLALRDVASACIDVSDGLLADLGHVCAASDVGAEIDLEALPLSAELRAAFDEDACRNLALAGGDDYELCFTTPPERVPAVEAVFTELGLRVTRIGRIVAGPGVRVRDVNGNAIDAPRAGWEHFTQ